MTVPSAGDILLALLRSLEHRKDDFVHFGLRCEARDEEYVHVIPSHQPEVTSRHTDLAVLTGSSGLDAVVFSPRLAERVSAQLTARGLGQIPFVINDGNYHRDGITAEDIGTMGLVTFTQTVADALRALSPKRP